MLNLLCKSYLTFLSLVQSKLSLKSSFSSDRQKSSSVKSVKESELKDPSMNFELIGDTFLKTTIITNETSPPLRPVVHNKSLSIHSIEYVYGLFEDFLGHILNISNSCHRQKAQLQTPSIQVRIELL